MAGRSALPLFLPVEAELGRRLEAETARVERRVADAEAEAARIRTEGEAAVRDVVVEAEAQAVREAERRERERINDVRVRIERWLEESERAAEAAVDDALDSCCEG